jgi:muramoyltetrapeptide carboxypeptidase
MIRPPALRPGARISLVAPAGPLAPGAVELATERIRGWGWEPRVGEHASGRHGYLSGTDEQRASDLNAALRDPDNDAIWFLRGGYGTMRIIDRIDWDALVRRPRPVIGFSDNTAFHLVLRSLGLVSFHGPHPATAEFPDYSLQGIHRVMTIAAPPGPIPFPDPEARAETVVGGRAEGRLVGGNLALLAAMTGTPYGPRAEGAILFFEEVGEAVYRLDRLLTQLRLAGVLDGVAGVAIGAITESPDTAPDLPTPAEVVADVLGTLGVPVAIGFPFGHVPQNWTLPVGGLARLDAGAGTLELLEAAVR